MAKIKVACLSETPESYNITTRRHNTEDRVLKIQEIEILIHSR